MFSCVENFLSAQTICFTCFILTKLNFYLSCQEYFSRFVYVITPKILHANVITCKILCAVSCFLMQYIFLHVFTWQDNNFTCKNTFSCNYMSTEVLHVILREGKFAVITLKVEQEGFSLE